MHGPKAPYGNRMHTDSPALGVSKLSPCDARHPQQLILLKKVQQE